MDFFLFEGPPTGCGEILFFKLIILLPSQRSTVRETRQILSSDGPRSAGGAQGPSAGKDATVIQYNTKFVKRHVAVASEALVNRTVKKHRRRRTNVLEV